MGIPTDIIFIITEGERVLHHHLKNSLVDTANVSNHGTLQRIGSIGDFRVFSMEGQDRWASSSSLPRAALARLGQSFILVVACLLHVRRNIDRDKWWKCLPRGMKEWKNDSCVMH